MDAGIRGIVNERIQSLKECYNKRVRELYKKIIALDNEIEKLRNLLRSPEKMEENDEKLRENIREMLRISRNPYKIWKTISDIQGGT